MGLIKNNLRGKAVLLTEGSTWIGLQAVLRLAREGAQVYLTCPRDSVDGQAVLRRFAEAGARPPSLMAADMAKERATECVLQLIHQQHERIEVFVSDASIAKIEGRLECYDKQAFLASMSSCAWPMVGYLQQIKHHFGLYPRYAIGISCDSPDRYYPGHDFTAAARAVQDVFCRYLAGHLLGQDARVNVLRTRPFSTDSLTTTFSGEIDQCAHRSWGESYFIEAEAVADAVLAFCSGLLDGVSGQVMLLDKGHAFSDNLMRLLEQKCPLV